MFHSFYSLGVSEFVLLTAMAYDRYVSTCKPLQYPTASSTTVVVLVLMGPDSAGSIWRTCGPPDREAKHCGLTIGVIAVIINVPLPLCFILFTYTKILIISFRSRRNVRRKAAQTCLPHLLVLIIISIIAIIQNMIG
uniref:G-protein coupled receptors family 1 profile domain-containing protein n=1 Tax=Anabas testudineus TaxID=64144 RepID=A0A7N6BJE2_ANATE